jgi:hypothetical protein
MTVYLRFRDLRARGIVNNWNTLQEWISKRGFPKGRLLGPNARAWAEDEVEAWIATRPTAPKPISKKARRGRPRKAENTHNASA